MKLERLTMNETADAYVVVTPAGDVAAECSTATYGDWAYRTAVNLAKAQEEVSGTPGYRVVRVTREFRSWVVEVG